MWIVKCFSVTLLSVLVRCNIELRELLPHSLDGESPAFSYSPTDSNGPQNWKDNYPICGGERQSPINIVTNHQTETNKTFIISGFDDRPCSITFTNSDGSLRMKLNYVDNSKVYFEGGPLNDKYIVDNIHFHWGPNDDDGSEHAIDGRKFAAEAHVVSYNFKYGKLSNAATKPDGLAVLGVLYKVRKLI